MNLTAKTIVKNKFWIVENEGQKVATIQATDNGLVLVKGQDRESFVDFRSLTSKYNIHVTKPQTTKNRDNSIYGFPSSGRSYNVIFDVKRKLPFYTKTKKSKSFFCAGYYAIFLNNEWAVQFCPKGITVKRYPYHGPFKTEEEAQTKALMCVDNGDK